MGAFVRWVALAATLWVAAFGTASADAVSQADQQAIHKVIQVQLDAFRKGDFDTAYAVAAPGLKLIYPTVQAFAMLVRGRYSILLQPKAVVFGTVVETTVGPVQRVFVTASDGGAYLATYALQQQPDNSWLIAGCTITRDTTSSGI